MKSGRPYAALLAGAALAVGAWLAFPGPGNAEKLLPDVGYTLLDGTHGTTTALRGKVLLINFWATDCTTCAHEMPQVAATYEKFKARGYDTLAVAMSYDKPASIQNFATTRRLPFPVTHDADGRMAGSIGNVQMTPTSVLVNKHGQIVKRYVGEPDFVALGELVDRLLGES